MDAYENERCGRGGFPALSVRLSHVPTKGGRRRAPNRFQARCRACGCPVGPGEGCIEKDSFTGKWIIFC